MIFLHHKLTTPEMATQCQLIFDSLSTIQSQLTHTTILPTVVPNDGLGVSTIISTLSSSSSSPLMTNTIKEKWIQLPHYIFETYPSTSKLLIIATALLCHPFQRDNQINYLQKFDITYERIEGLVREIDESVILIQKEMNGGTAKREGELTNEISSSFSGGTTGSGHNNGGRGGGSGSHPSTPSSSKKMSASIKNLFGR
jgi:hypothetical protein